MKKFGIVSIVLVLALTHSFCASDMGGGATDGVRKPYTKEEVLEKRSAIPKQNVNLVIGVSPYEADRDLGRPLLYTDPHIFLLSTDAPLVPTKDESRFFYLDFNSPNFFAFSRQFSGRFDSIYFDWSTYKFVKSDGHMAQALQSLLKKGGQVYIPAPYDFKGGLMPTLSDLKGTVDDSIYHKYKHHLDREDSLDIYKHQLAHDLKQARGHRIKEAFEKEKFKVEIMDSEEIQDSHVFPLIQHNMIEKNKAIRDSQGLSEDYRFRVLVATKE